MSQITSQRIIIILCDVICDMFNLLAAKVQNDKYILAQLYKYQNYFS